MSRASLSSSTLASRSVDGIEDSLAADFNLCFTPGGFLVPYYLGVIYGLKKIGLLKSDIPISGTSAGALAAAFVISKASFSDCLEITKQIQQQLLEQGHGRKVIPILKAALEDFLPSDVHESATGRIGIGVTVYSPKKRVSGKVLTQFDSKADFVDAVIASCYIPFYFGPKLGVEQRNGYIYSDDHHCTHTQFSLLGAKWRVFQISAFPKPNRLLFDDRSVDISPDLRKARDIPSVWKIVWNGFVPLQVHEIDHYAESGLSDIILWVKNGQAETTSHATKYSTAIKMTI